MMMTYTSPAREMKQETTFLLFLCVSKKKCQIVKRKDFLLGPSLILSFGAVFFVDMVEIV